MTIERIVMCPVGTPLSDGLQTPCGKTMPCPDHSVDPRDVSLARKLSYTLDDNSVCDARVARELETERREILAWVEGLWHQPTRSEIVGFLKGRIEADEE